MGGGRHIYYYVKVKRWPLLLFCIFQFLTFFPCDSVKIRTRRRVRSGAKIWKSFFRMTAEPKVKSHGWCTNTSKVGLHTRDTHSYTFFSLFKKEKTIFGRHRIENEPLCGNLIPKTNLHLYVRVHFWLFGEFLYFYFETSPWHAILLHLKFPPLIRQRFLEKYLKDSHLTKITR